MLLSTHWWFWFGSYDVAAGSGHHGYLRPFYNVSQDGPLVTGKALKVDLLSGVLETDDGLLGLERTATDGGQRIIALFNFTDEDRHIGRDLLPGDPGAWQELIGMAGIEFTADALRLPPRTSKYWLSDTWRKSTVLRQPLANSVR